MNNRFRNLKINLVHDYVSCYNPLNIDLCDSLINSFVIIDQLEKNDYQLPLAYISDNDILLCWYIEETMIKIIISFDSIGIIVMKNGELLLSSEEYKFSKEINPDLIKYMDEWIYKQKEL